MIHALIFDVDGVLLDSVELHLKAWQKTFESKGISVAPEDYVIKLNGLPREQGIRNILPDASDKQIKEIADLKQSHFIKSIEKGKIEPIEHVSKTLQILSKKYKLAAASSSKNAPDLLRKTGLDGFFDVIVSGHDFKKSKPDPEIFLLAAHQLGVNPKNCIVIEDADAGVQAAHAGDMDSIGFDRSGDEKLRKSAHHIISTFDQLVAVLENLK